ncbi:MAG: TetR/AcrR family transcriptional regulator C-terminal domain-containing protein [Clostridia bacterium]|nr:TetR/AcrR family transcriptional regulator C-terminal domain-containing protein [Clostridia bacterium]
MKHEITSMNTKKALARSLRSAMEKKTFSKITVSEIISDCGVNRKTFYYHFQDIYALLKWMLEQDAIEVVKKFDLIVDYEEAITFVMDYVESNNHIINCAYDSIGHDHVKSFFYSDFISLASDLITNAENKIGLKLDEDYKKFLSKFYTEALSGMLMDWIKNREQIDRKSIIDYISKTIRVSLVQTIRTYGR